MFIIYNVGLIRIGIITKQITGKIKEAISIKLIFGWITIWSSFKFVDCWQRWEGYEGEFGEGQEGSY